MVPFGHNGNKGLSQSGHVEGDCDGIDEGDVEASRAENTDSSNKKLKSRLRWSPHLHSCFVDAVNQLGGAHKAKPKALLRMMDVKGITLHHLKSHLQKYRLRKYSIGECDQVSKNGSSRSSEITTSLSYPQSDHHDKGDELNNAEQQTNADIQALFHLQTEAETRLRICQDAERRYLNSVFRSACMLADRYLCSTAVDTEEAFNQNVSSFKSTSTTSPFYPIEPFSTSPNDTSLGHQSSRVSLTSCNDFARLSSEVGKKDEQILEEDPAKTYLNLDNTRPGSESDYDGTLG